MADYESDSSGDDNGDIQTNVLLGYASKEPTGDDFSKLGGLPTWLDADTPPSGAYAKCKVCNGVMSLLLQLNGDLPERFPGHERRLYVFGCRRKACRRRDGCIRALRGGRVDKRAAATAKAKESERTQQQPPTTSKSNLGETLFGVKPTSTVPANPFSTNSNPASNGTGLMTNPFSTSSSITTPPAPDNTGVSSETPRETFAEKARLASPEKSTVSTSTSMSPWEPWLSDPSPFPEYHVDADNEYLDQESSNKNVPSNARLDPSFDSGSGGLEDNKAAFESAMDKTFQKFADRLAQNPEQVLRYEFDGDVLLYSKSDTVGKLLSPSSTVAGQNNKVQLVGESSNGVSLSKMPRCQNCGAARTFELQLTPHAITELEAEETGLDGMDWGTIIVGVCKADCQESDSNKAGHIEEWAGVQWEELADSAKRK